MSGNHRSHRRKKSNAGRIGLAGALAGVLGAGALVAGHLALRPDAGEEAPARPRKAVRDASLTVAPSPTTGPTLSVTTPEGYTYALGAVRTGVEDRPLSQSTPPPPGRTHAYGEYVLTNTMRRPILLDFPADLYLSRAHVPEELRDRCAPQAGVPDDLCTPPTHSEVVARLDGSEPPIEEDSGDRLMPPGASYLVRIATQMPMEEGIADGTVRLYVWHARFTADRRGIEVRLP
ncbi:hypothetical protein [Thermomonospora catenispora]|uniref:hypothetical protein n=1 Tax=Thermomonospora catenispora TaxID=2493090 RepID=UPI00111EC402|nr:hypothetical protein [Thermomonospora catenispora]TNY35023.1 hypothetical protein EIO00_20630 [Thermomonospora catenispora]